MAKPEKTPEEATAALLEELKKIKQKAPSPPKNK